MLAWLRHLCRKPNFVNFPALADDVVIAPAPFLFMVNMKLTIAPYLIAACAFLASAEAAFAHVVLLEPVAAAATSYRAAFRVGHGCSGASTMAIRVVIPAGFNGAQPMPKAGWTIKTVKGPLATPYESHGKKFTEGVTEISWTAMGAENALPDTYYEEFVMRGMTPVKPGPLWFKVYQSCDKGANEWVEIPASGISTKGLRSPAALLEVLDIQPAGGHNH